ncbi:MAG: 2-isopropylmalate synthase, partial [Chitinivibrionales bacterium]|nr:2-isopropylmalate synthase [Chitinivibrionales bacterium]MBD3357873.1 2-isopropylmalate synthase [Chitinivibrionales bacterium]
PMSIDQKRTFFDFLVQMGFQDIEIAFPSASKVDFDFTRSLIEEERIPEGVALQVLTQAREHLIERTFEALAGVPRAVVHLYNSTSPAQRRVVFGKSMQEIIEIAVKGTLFVKEHARAAGEDRIVFEYSPESFSLTEPSFARDICNAVIETWEPTPKRKMILNLPSTVEASTPNVYADQIEWMSRNIVKRGSVILSVHTHNDRGGAVAAAELALLAGAERVEGTLFGNGERTGNCDLVTMALNLYSQGIDPRVRIDAIDEIAAMYEQSTTMNVGPRHPYAGKLVFTAFSGSHQDAINKGLKEYKKSGGTWDVPYLPIDPEDIGRTYESVIRINSQSGKGGVTHVLERDFGLFLPKAMQPEVGAAIQRVSDAEGRELSPGEIWQVFEQEYLNHKNALHLVDMRSSHDSAHTTRVVATVTGNGRSEVIESTGNGVIDALSRGLLKRGLKFKVTAYDEHAMGEGADATAVAYIQLERNDGNRFFGVGIDSDIAAASASALLSAANRAYA